MSLPPEWRVRVERWRAALHALVYEKLGIVPLSGFVTKEQLTPEQACARRFKAMPAGVEWGAAWEYGWFRSRVVLPREARGRRIVLCPETGAESRVLVNGREAGGRDAEHAEILLSVRGRPGERFDILIESYAGHGPRRCDTGPVLHGQAPFADAPARQAKVSISTFGAWDEELWQLWVDVETLFQLRSQLDPDSLRVAEIDAALRDFTLLVDLELPRGEVRAAAGRARRRLRPLLECRNGSTAPKFFCVGHSHIDVAWLWPLQETERKCARTFATQLGLMERYPEYKFLQSQPHLYRMTAKLYPELYTRIRAAARSGQWIPEGGMWVEPDTNLAGGESLIRQFLHGKEFFRKEFGVESRLLWLPDVFGYSGALPQIMAGCGVPYFSTQKIQWTYNGGDPFPYNSFWWEGIDGTRVLSHIHGNYNSKTDPATLVSRWRDRVQKDGIRSRLVPFGFGDGGGGPTRLHLEYLRRQRDLEGAPRCQMTHPVAFFRDLEKDAAQLPVYVGELYFQAHRGTYTTQARVKRGNRRCEFALREAEMWGAIAGATRRFAWPDRKMGAAWTSVLLNQFHDIIPGSSIQRVYEEANAAYDAVLASATDVTRRAAGALVAKKSRSVTVFNSLSWDRRAMVELPADFRGAAADGKPLATQRIGKRRYAEVVAPSCGWVTVVDAAVRVQVDPVITSDRHLENDLIRATFNDRGEITRLLDKETNYDFAAGALNSLRMYKDVPARFDAWDLDSMYTRQPVALDSRVTIKRIASGLLAGALRIQRNIHRSTLTQEVWLRRESRTLEFRTRVDWQERHKLLKVNFPLRVHANEALHEVQFGHLARPNHKSRPFDADRFEVSQMKWTALIEAGRGAGVLNDCKYGVDVDGGSINLTLLRAPTAPDKTADLGRHEFTYALHLWNGPFVDSDIIRKSYELNAPPLTVPGAAKKESMFGLSHANIVLETVKPAHDGTGDVIVRLYEAKRSGTRCELRTALPASHVAETDMLEAGGRKRPVRDGVITLTFRPFEIKTLRFSLA